MAIGSSRARRRAGRPLIALAPEAFASGPFGGIVLVGSDDGATSHVQAIDVARGCAWPLAAERDVVRRATIDPAGTFIYEMRVDRASRADLGIWRRPIDGAFASRQVLGPPPPDARFGRTFSTEFTWDVAGDRLAVQSCAEIACRIRVITPGGGPTVTLDEPGARSDRRSRWRPGRDIRGMSGTPLPDRLDRPPDGRSPGPRASRGLAVVIRTADGARLVHEVGAGSARRLRSVAPGGDGALDLGLIPDDLRLHPSAVRAGAATSLPAGWVLLAPGGSPSGRRQHRPPAAPPRPGRLDRPAR